MTTLVRPRRVTRREQVEYGPREEPGTKPTYTRPDPAVDINLGDTWQTIVNGQPAGTTFWVRSGRHVRPTVNPRTGDRFFFEFGAEMDGEDVASYAFDRVPNLADRVGIYNAKVTRYVAVDQMGAIRGADHGYTNAGVGWVLEDCEVSHSHHGGIRVGHFWTIRRVWSHHNRQNNTNGIATGTVIEDCDLSFGNYLDEFNPGFEAGGTKFVLSGWGGSSGGTRTGTDPGVTIRHTEVYENHGPGLWLDIDNIDNYLYRNHVHHNRVSSAGGNNPPIFIEISYRTLVQYNLIEDNDGASTWGYDAGVLVAHSEDVSVWDNVVRNNWNGIALMQQSRVEHTHDHKLLRADVRRNQVRHARNGGWAAGLFEDVTGTQAYIDNADAFDDNDYEVTALRTVPFQWLNASKSWTAWQTTYGHDTNGSFTTF